MSSCHEMVKCTCLFVLRVCASKWEIYAGKLVIIACVCETCVHMHPRKWIYFEHVCVCSACVWIMFSVYIFEPGFVLNLLIKSQLFLWRATVCHPCRLIIPLWDFSRFLMGHCCIHSFKITVNTVWIADGNGKNELEAAQEQQRSLCLSSTTLFLMNTDVCWKVSNWAFNLVPCSS